ncbi:Retrovirus-related Pol polyprotein from transposon TNT 1-94 [Vitis vinifera]|uniref:Retrovirus-related Pol polyprotein from transposon TNT 1-94 n=1 Tax=Vitis vinifera TaxID=29760 RepID=A0A438H5J7_VITVI|nr:Retrovirus-related Pol polyprotein from transposon TNT 1-94 [Vitis vinifera]
MLSEVEIDVWTSSPVDYSGLRVFECPAYVHIPNEERSKLDAKSRQCIFLGYQKGVKGFKLWDPKANKVVISRDVVFDEKPMLQCTQKGEKQEPESCSSNEKLIQVELETHDIEDHAWNAGKSSSEDQQHHNIAMDRPRRTIKPLISQEKSRWMGAMVEEIQSLYKNQTWDLVELPEGKRAI